MQNDTTTALMNNYAQLPVSFEYGKGVWLFDENNNKYLDAISGLGVCGLGHSHPAVTKAVCSQAKKLLHTSNLYNIKKQAGLAELLVRVSGMEKAFFANSGAEANEAAIKLARYYGNQKGFKTPSVIVTDNAFHGRTMATLAASTGDKIQKGFEPLVQGFIRVPFNDAKAVEDAFEANVEVVAVMVEPVQGEGGINIPGESYLSELRKICDEKDALLILDEVQCGNGRTGRYFAYQHYGIYPDVVTTAKGLANGLPVGACLAKGRAAGLFTPGKHASTFGGNPFVCAAAVEVVRTISGKNLANRAEVLGKRILRDLKKNLEHLPHVADIRGKGLMIAVELDVKCTDLVKQGLEKGILINVTRENILRLLPPLVTKNSEAAIIAEKVTGLITDYVKLL